MIECHSFPPQHVSLNSFFDALTTALHTALHLCRKTMSLAPDHCKRFQIRVSCLKLCTKSKGKAWRMVFQWRTNWSLRTQQHESVGRWLWLWTWCLQISSHRVPSWNECFKDFDFDLRLKIASAIATMKKLQSKCSLRFWVELVLHKVCTCSTKAFTMTLWSRCWEVLKPVFSQHPNFQHGGLYCLWTTCFMRNALSGSCETSGSHSAKLVIALVRLHPHLLHPAPEHVHVIVCVVILVQCTQCAACGRHSNINI